MHHNQILDGFRRFSDQSNFCSFLNRSCPVTRKTSTENILVQWLELLRAKQVVWGQSLVNSLSVVEVLSLMTKTQITESFLEKSLKS